MPVSPRRARAAATLACSVLLLAPAAGHAADFSAPALDDGYINAADPGRAFGDAKQLLVSRSPLRTAYLRFRVDRASAAHRMVLRLHALGGAGDAVLVVRRLGARDWRERTLTARAAPRVGRVAGSRASFGRGWISVSLGAPAPVGGVYGLALTVVGDRALRFSSREAGSRYAPRLSDGGGLAQAPPSAPSTPMATTRPPASARLSDDAAADRVRPALEIRAANRAQDHIVATAQQLDAFRKASREPYTTGVTGGYVGTTDEIIQWAAWKWGVDEDLMRAVAVQESDWRQAAVGDGGVSFGLYSVKTQLAPGHDGWPGTHPLARDSTAFNADYYGRAFRSCYDGRERWLGDPYAAGDAWGCVGLWFSGGWHDAGAEAYVRAVRGSLEARTWERPG
ncbi:MAG: hypothetical protein M3P44_15450 [Actinomycetota bacterium]|nr:hypothetical protein [Actinomycetota bacterium]